MGLTWDRIDLDSRTVKVDRQMTPRGIFGPPKTKRSKRVVPMPEMVAAALIAHRADFPPTRQDIAHTDGYTVRGAELVFFRANSKPANARDCGRGFQLARHVTDDDQGRSIVSRLVDALPSGSHLVIADGTNVVNTAFEQAQGTYDDSGAAPYRLRATDQITRFFDGVDLLEPAWSPACGGGRRPTRSALRRRSSHSAGRAQALICAVRIHSTASPGVRNGLR